MKRLMVLLATVLVSAVTAMAQQIPATSEENARIKPLIEIMNKANEPLFAKRSALPESKAVSDARTALQKAIDAEAVAVQKLPEFEAVKSAEAKVLDELYRILASHKLSSREYRPTISDKGEVAFVKTEPIKP